MQRARTREQSVATDAGPGRLVVAEAPDPTVVVMLGGGASGQVHTADLDALAAALPGRGITVARYELPWRVAGKKMGPRPPASDPWWDAGLAAVRTAYPGIPVITGGRSAGARIACRTWTPEVPAVVALSFPLHPPGHPEKSRAAELRRVGGPVLMVSGARDPFGSAPEWREECRQAHAGPREFVEIPGATHSFPSQTTASVVEAAALFLQRW
ncbi:MAG: alpha/beta family hydrolase [Propioniciclava sp.]